MSAPLESDEVVSPTTFYARKTPPPPQQTPVSPRLSSQLPFTSNAEYTRPAFTALAHESHGRFIGPVAIENFLSFFMPDEPATPHVIPMPPIDYEEAAKIAAMKREVDQYDPLVRHIVPLSSRLTT